MRMPFQFDCERAIQNFYFLETGADQRTLASVGALRGSTEEDGEKSRDHGAKFDRNLSLIGKVRDAPGGGKPAGKITFQHPATVSE